MQLYAMVILRSWPLSQRLSKMASGLGGTSQINANVFLETDEASFQQEQWPREIRENPHGELDQCKLSSVLVHLN
jgi:hypothetical protein